MSTLHHPGPSRRLMALLLAATLALAACGTRVVNPVSGREERSVMDEPTEVAEGAKAHPQILAEYGVVDDKALQAYVDGVGQKLAKLSHRAHLKWTFTVLDSPEVNAFALPGGYVYVTRGIMAYLDSEADLAGVLGHEIGHVTARHGAQRATRQANAGLGVLAATVLGVLVEGATGVGGVAQAAQQVGQGVAAGRLASYSREQELQADELGAEYLSRSRYDPRNMVDVIGVLKAQERFLADRARAEGRSAPQGTNWLASHPSNDQRLADIQRVAARYSGPYTDDGRARYHRAIQGLAFGDSAAQGLVRGRQFLHTGLEIALTALEGWQVKNGSEAVTLVNAAGDAGLVLRLVPEKAGKTHDEVIRNVFQPVDGRSERTALNGLQATRFAGTARNAQGQAVGVRATVVSGPGNRLFMLQSLAANAEARQKAAAGLAEAEGSFRALTAADRSAARPWTLQVVTMPPGGFAELARSTPLPAQAEAYLRLLNGVYGSGTEPKAGSPVKTVR